MTLQFILLAFAFCQYSFNEASAQVLSFTKDGPHVQCKVPSNPELQMALGTSGGYIDGTTPAVAAGMLSAALTDKKREWSSLPVECADPKDATSRSVSNGMLEFKCRVSWSPAAADKEPMETVTVKASSADSAISSVLASAKFGRKDPTSYADCANGATKSSSTTLTTYFCGSKPYGGETTMKQNVDYVALPAKDMNSAAAATMAGAFANGQKTRFGPLGTKCATSMNDLKAALLSGSASTSAPSGTSNVSGAVR